MADRRDGRLSSCGSQSNKGDEEYRSAVHWQTVTLVRGWASEEGSVERGDGFVQELGRPCYISVRGLG